MSPRSFFYLDPKGLLQNSDKALRHSAEKDFKLDDPDGEQKYQFILDEALERAKRGKLFAGYTIYLTPKVDIDFKLLDEVVKSSGGKVRNPFFVDRFWLS